MWILKILNKILFYFNKNVFFAILSFLSKKRQGFIGPIGDDLPSLIPILFSLLIFFSAFTFAFNEFNSENAIIKNKLSAIQVARDLKQTSFISTIEQFERLCEQSKATDISFIAGLVNLNDKTNSNELNFIHDPNPNSEKVFVCTSQEFDETPISELKIPEEGLTFSLTYPVALEYGTLIIPTHLIVIAWH